MSPARHEGLIPCDPGDSSGEGWPLGMFDVWNDLPGVAHAITSKACPVFDPQADSGTNLLCYSDLCRILRLGGLSFCEQVHGPDVLVVDKSGPAGKADALISNVGGLGLLIRCADCPVILLADKIGSAVGIIHASWRSTLQLITTSTVKAMQEAFSIPPSSFRAIICPSAGPCCYQVGPEVRDQAIERLGRNSAAFFPERNGSLYFDLWAANKDQLVRQGVIADNIYISGICTICRNDMFPSFRVEDRQARRFACLVARRT